MDETEDLSNPFPEPFVLEITDVLDLHAFNPKDIKSILHVYLLEARKKNFQAVRIIHGKGIGVQKEIVRQILTETTFVKSFKNAPEFSGNWGSTIVNFD